jgi:hypothetical protein
MLAQRSGFIGYLRLNFGITLIYIQLLVFLLLKSCMVIHLECLAFELLMHLRWEYWMIGYKREM